MILFLENNIRGGICSVMGDRYVKSDESKTIIYIDANTLYGHSMSQPLPYDRNKCKRSCKLEDILNTPDAFVLSLNTKDFIKDLKNLEEIFDFSKLDKIHELFSKKNLKSNWLIQN